MAPRTNKKHIVQLARDERIRIEKAIDARKIPLRPRLRLQVLLLADVSTGGPGLTDEQIHERTQLSVRTIEWVRATYCERGIRALTTWRGQPLRVAGLESSSRSKPTASAN